MQTYFNILFLNINIIVNIIFINNKYFIFSLIWTIAKDVYSLELV